MTHLFWGKDRSSRGVELSRHLSVLALLFLLTCLSILTVPLNAQAQVPTVYISPQTSTAYNLGDTVSVNVTVDAASLLFAWEFQIYYDSGILNASKWIPGPDFTSPDVMIFEQTWNDSYYNATGGLLDIVCTSIGQGTINGTTTLATLYFTTKSWGNAILDLDNTSLLDNSAPFPQPITHTATGGTVFVGIPGDLNHDGKVNLEDLVILARAYGSHCANYDYQGEPASPNWNPVADITGSGRVGLNDLVILAEHYGQSAS
jgi:hypothetical protein